MHLSGILIIGRAFYLFFVYQSVLVQTHYKELGRRDLQATGIFAVVISRNEARKIRPRDEVADTKWVPNGELQGIHMCNQ